jgi:hypothetical protein
MNDIPQNLDWVTGGLIEGPGLFSTAGRRDIAVSFSVARMRRRSKVGCRNPLICKGAGFDSAQRVLLRLIFLRTRLEAKTRLENGARSAPSNHL